MMPRTRQIAALGNGQDAETVLVRDTFVDANGTHINSHTPDIDVAGNGWSTLNGTPQIQSNRLQASGSSNAQAVIDCEQSDVTITVTLRVTKAASWAAVLARCVSKSNWWYIKVNADTDQFELYERSTLRDSAGVTIDHDTDYAVVVTLAGTNLSATLDGAHELSYSSATYQTETKHGIMLDDATSGPAIADDFVITQ